MDEKDIFDLVNATNQRIDNLNEKIDSLLHNFHNASTKAIEVNTSDIADTMDGLTETYEAVGGNADDIAICMDAITELFEMIGE